MKENSLSKNVFQTFGAKIIAFCLAFIASAFITRLLGPEGKGVQIFINTNVSLFTIILGLNINAFLLYFAAKDEITKRRALTFALISIFTLFSIFLSVFWTLKKIDSNFLNFLIPDEFQNGIYPVYFSLFLFISLIGSIIGGYWQGNKRFKYVNLLVICAATIKVISYGSAFLGEKLKWFSLNTEQVFYVIIIAMMLTFLIRLFLFLFKSDLKIDFAIRPDLPQFLGFINLGYLAALLNFANKRIDLWFIEHFNTVQELGFYGLAAQLTNMIITFILPVTFVVAPYITKASKEKGQQLIARFSRFVFSFAVITITFVFATAWFFIPLLFGEVFSASVLPLQILSIGAMLLLFRNVFAVYNISKNSLRPNLIANLLAFIATIIFDYLWIPKYGVVGAAYASIIAYAISSIYVFLSVYLKLDINLVNYFFVNRADVKFLMTKGKKLISTYK